MADDGSSLSYAGAEPLASSTFIEELRKTYQRPPTAQEKDRQRRELKRKARAKRNGSRAQRYKF